MLTIFHKFQITGESFFCTGKRVKGQNTGRMKRDMDSLPKTKNMYGGVEKSVSLTLQKFEDKKMDLGKHTFVFCQKGYCC